jgi:undecaprenyl-diphosphatase
VAVAAVAIGVVLVVVVLARVMAGSPDWNHMELGVDQAFSLHHAAALNAIALAIAWILSPIHGLILLLLICAGVWWRVRDPLVSLTFALVVLGGWLSSELIKIVVHRARPDFHLLAHPLSFETSFDSFPSGHTCLATALAVGFIFLLRGRRWQRTAVILGALFVVVVALSRLYIGAHYPTDIIGSMLYTTAAMTAFLAIWNRWLAPLVAPLFAGSGRRRALRR